MIDGKNNNNKQKKIHKMHLPPKFLVLEFSFLPLLPPALLNHFFLLTDERHKALNNPRPHGPSGWQRTFPLFMMHKIREHQPQIAPTSRILSVSTAKITGCISLTIYTICQSSPAYSLPLNLRNQSLGSFYSLRYLRLLLYLFMELIIWKEMSLPHLL